MANYTKINTRLQLKFDTWTNWNSTTGKAFIPLKGEVCIAEIPENTTADGELLADKAYLIKVGDGTATFESLPWLSALAADVHEWAKLPYEKFTELLDKGTLTYNGKTYTGTSFATNAELDALSSKVTIIENKISNAMHFLGSTTTPLTDGATTKTLVGISATITAGAVVLAPYGSADAERYEFVWVGEAWEMLGQEGSFAIKGSIYDADIADAAAIKQTKIASTLKKTDLADDIKDLDTRIEANAQAITNNKSTTDLYRSYATVTGDSGTTTTADKINDSLAINGDAKIGVTVSADKVAISHKAQGEAIDRPKEKDTTSAATPAHKGTFTAIDSVSTDATGHVIGVNTKTVTLPSVDEINSSIDAVEEIVNNKTWKTNTLVVETDKTKFSSLSASDLTIGSTAIEYIIFDCGSSEKNI